MAQIINTNIMSLNAQRNLNSSATSLATSIQRLSSGLRINSAKDDAAGLAISQRFTTQIRGLDVATRNANDGISLAQTAEGAMVEIGNNLQRIRELAVQSANATNSQSDRDALQSEVGQLLKEIDRVANQTSFNGTKLLDGTFSSQLFQIGADAGQTIGINSIVDANIAELGKTGFAEVQTATAVLASGVATASGSVSGIKINGQDIEAVDVAIGDAAADVQKKVVSAINDKMDLTGVHAELDDTDHLVLTSVKAGQDFSFTAGTSDATGLGVNFTAIGTDVKVADNTDGPQHLGDVNISSFNGAQQALEITTKALDAVNRSRADMGAIQNRFSSTISNLATTSENLSASRGRIQDADYAKETAELTRTQILQQAGTAMLAQVNSNPQNVLSLLR